MIHIDFSTILSSALTPITLISGVGLLLMAMSLVFILIIHLIGAKGAKNRG